MTDPAQEDITGLLALVRAGDAAAKDRLLEVVYGQLRRMAQLQTAGERDGELEATELVHELYMKLNNQERLVASDRRHFFAIAARAMRQILIDKARRASRRRRRGSVLDDSADAGAVAADDDPRRLLDLAEALDRLEAEDTRLYEVVAMRFFAGLTYEQTAETVGRSVATVVRDWNYAKLWLLDRINEKS